MLLYQQEDFSFSPAEDKVLVDTKRLTKGIAEKRARNMTSGRLLLLHGMHKGTTQMNIHLFPLLSRTQILHNTVYTVHETTSLWGNPFTKSYPRVLWPRSFFAQFWGEKTLAAGTCERILNLAGVFLPVFSPVFSPFYLYAISDTRDLRHRRNIR